MGRMDRQPDNPVEAEYQVWQLGQWLDKGVGVIGQYEADYLHARRTRERAEARAKLSAEGRTADLRAAEVVLAVVAEQDAEDVAELAFNDAKRTQAVLEKRHSGAQSSLKSMMQAYSSAGVGER